MWRMVVLDQVQRNDTGFRLFERLNEIAGLSLFNPAEHLTWLLLVALIVIVGSMVLAGFHPRTRPAVLLLGGLVVLLLLTPSWFVHYSALTAALVAVVIGTGGQLLVRARGLRQLRGIRVGLGALLVLGLLAASLPVATASIGEKFPGRSLQAAVANRSWKTVQSWPVGDPGRWLHAAAAAAAVS